MRTPSLFFLAFALLISCARCGAGSQAQRTDCVEQAGVRVCGDATTVRSTTFSTWRR